MSKIESELNIPTVKLSPTNGGQYNTVIDFSDHEQETNNVVATARKVFDQGRTKPIKFRKTQLRNLLKFLKEKKDAILEALHKDLRKPKLEGICYEINIIESEAQHMLNHLDEWVIPEKRKKPLANLFDDLFVYNDPYGVVLVMGAWNYPLQLTLAPVVGAMAAGNCVVIKPSDLAPATGELMRELLPKYLDPECYPVFLGGVEETTELLKERFDYIFYTGSTMVGRIIHKAANKYLTPTTLELGGKSPAYIDSSADIAKTVKRILWGKCLNSGQTCIAPDYILCTKQVQEKFVQYAGKALTEFYGGDIKESLDFCRIINERHFNRVINLMSGLKIALGGRYDPKDRFIEPTIAVDVHPNDPIMQEEIFGPILPMIVINNLQEAIDFINQREKPLALYIFTNNKRDWEEMLQKTSSGGVLINDVVLHVAVDSLPFGGVGSSGMGAYHGKASFDTFVHKKSVLLKNFGAIPDKILANRYPPYSENKIYMMTEGSKQRKRLPLKYVPYLLTFVLGILVTVGVYFLYQALKG